VATNLREEEPDNQDQNDDDHPIVTSNDRPPHVGSKVRARSGRPTAGLKDDSPIVRQTCVPDPNPLGWHNVTTSNPYPAPIQDQGNCGSCYAFTATELMYTLVSIQKQKSFHFSPQQIVDCDNDDLGCNGGWPGTVLDYASNAYVANIETYPYS